MLFNSYEFLFFIPSLFVIFWISHKSVKLQNIILLIASYIFYGWWDWRFLGLIIFSSGVDYICGKWIYETKDLRAKRLALGISLTSNLGLLFTFKYFNFFVNSFISAFATFDIILDPFTLNLILPVGISFYTFQTLSYTIDIYKGTLKPVNSPLTFFTFVAFFPQLVAGPIERAANLLPQFEQKGKVSFQEYKIALNIIILGFFKKVAIADNLAILVNEVYGDLDSYSSFSIFLACLGFTFQIYCDFSGYSDIAIGTAKLFGKDLMVNFNLPYFSKSIREFWQRWHISLSTWFRDYVYIPLGGNKRFVFRNLLITFLVSGLWHGANWTFVIWGGLHGIFIVIERIFLQKKRIVKTKSKLYFFEILKVLWVFTLVFIAWIFFRAIDIKQAIQVLFSLFAWVDGKSVLSTNLITPIILGFLSCLLLLFYEYIKFRSFSFLKNIFFRLSFQFLFIIFILYFAPTESSDFIYFQF